MAIESPMTSDVKMDLRALVRSILRRLVRIVIVTAVLVGAAYFVLRDVPKSYESTASILVAPRDNSYTTSGGDSGSLGGSTADLSATISNHVALIKSPDTLATVVQSLHLDQVPEFNGTAPSSIPILGKFLKKPAPSGNAAEIALGTLQDHVVAVRDRDSSVIDITVSSRDPDLAAKIANEIARADVERRAGLSVSDTEDASQWLQQQIDTLRQRVNDAETKVANFKVANDLYTSPNSAAGSTGPSLLDQQMTEVQTQITSAQERYDTAQSRSALIRGLLQAKQPIDGVDDVRNSATIQQLMSQKAQLTAQKAQLLATLLPSHPSVQAVTAQIDAVDKQIAIEGQRVADALDAEAKIENSTIAALNARLDIIKQNAATQTKQGVTLDALEREATADRDLLESYMTRYRDAAARTDANANLPDLRIVTAATPSLSASSPKTTLILFAVGFASVALQIGAILFGELLSGRALVEVPAAGAASQASLAPEPPVAAPRSAQASMPEPLDPALLMQASEATSENPNWSRRSRRAAKVPLGSSLERDTVAPAVEPANPEPVVAEVRRQNNSNLRSWFTKHARAAGATLTSFEPPISADADSSAAPAPAAVAPAATEPRETVEMPAVISAATTDPAAEAMAADLDEETDEEAYAAPRDPVLSQRNAELIDNLSADLILGRARIVVLAALTDTRDAEVLGERLVQEVVRRGLSIARVDAGSGRPSTEPGITDLSAERAAFGDVVHKTGRDGLAEVPWGHLTTLDRRSVRPITLVEALADIYEVVIVLTGRIGVASSLPLFAGLTSRLVIVPANGASAAVIDTARDELAALGFTHAEVIAAPEPAAEVA